MVAMMMDRGILTYLQSERGEAIAAACDTSVVREKCLRKWSKIPCLLQRVLDRLETNA